MQHDGGFHGRTGHNVQHDRGALRRSQCIRFERHHGLRALDHCLEGLHSRQSARIAGGDLYLCGALRHPFHSNDTARHGDRSHTGVQRRGFVREFVVIRIAEPGRGVYIYRLARIDRLGRDRAHCLRRLIDLIDRYTDFLGGRQPVRVPGGHRYRHGLLRCRCDRDRTSRCLDGGCLVSVQFLGCADRGVFFHVEVAGRNARRVHRGNLGRNRPRLLGHGSDRDRTSRRRRRGYIGVRGPDRIGEYVSIGVPEVGRHIHRDCFARSDRLGRDRAHGFRRPVRQIGPGDPVLVTGCDPGCREKKKKWEACA